MPARRIFTILIAALAVLLTASASLADKVHLKNGRVLEGEIIRETDGFLYVRVMIGSVGKDELVLRSDVDRIERTPEAEPEQPKRSVRSGDDLTDDEPAASPRDSSGAVRVAFITLEEMVGPYMFAPAFSDSVKALEDDDIDVVILRINSGGGALAEIEELSDVIEEEIKPKYRVAAWIESAISAAAMTASTCEEVYFMSEGNLGAATAFSPGAGGATRLDGLVLEQVLQLMVGISERGNRDPLVMRAMQIPMELSADFTADGQIIWRNDLKGQEVVSTMDDILTFDSQTAMRYRYARGVADTKDELMKLMGYTDWVEAGQDADEIQQRHRAEVARGETEVGKVWQKFNIAAEQGDFAKVRQYLGQLKAWGTRNKAFAKYGGGGSPPLSDEVFREIERQIDRQRRQQQSRNRN